MDRLSVLRSLGDGTRYAVYREVAGAPEACSTADIAKALRLHSNTVRPHLEWLREAGLLQVERDSQGTVGRPQHRYLLAPGAPSPSLEPDEFALLAEMLTSLVSGLDVDSEEVLRAGRSRGREECLAGAGSCPPRSCLERLMEELGGMGFDPASESLVAEGSVTVSFTHCPYRQLAEAHPDVVCQLHRGLVEGMVEALGGARVESFGTLADRQPCQVELVVG